VGGIKATASSDPSSRPKKPLGKLPAKRPAQMDPDNAPVYKRKLAPVNLFINNKRPASRADTGRKSGEKKETVKQRLARQMVSPSISSLTCDSSHLHDGVWGAREEHCCMNSILLIVAFALEICIHA
jgi:hypothetical protein